MEKAKEKEGKIVRCISPSGCYYRDSIIVFAIGRFIFNNGECAHHKVSNFTIKSRLSLGYHSKVERGGRMDSVTAVVVGFVVVVVLVVVVVVVACNAATFSSCNSERRSAAIEQPSEPFGG